jgi:hypothetical protein
MMIHRLGRMTDYVALILLNYKAGEPAY